jgi:ferredoxin
MTDCNDYENCSACRAKIDAAIEQSDIWMEELHQAAVANENRNDS